MNKFGAFLIIVSIGILVGVVFYIVNPLKILSDRNDKTRMQDLLGVSQALQMYYRDYGHYPHFSNGYIITTEDAHPWGFSWMPYTKMLPKDPNPLKRYVYWADKDNNYQSYRLYASLADPKATDASCKTGAECAGVPGPNLCGVNTGIPFLMSSPCNFGITSNNISP